MRRTNKKPLKIKAMNRSSFQPTTPHCCSTSCRHREGSRPDCASRPYKNGKSTNEKHLRRILRVGLRLAKTTSKRSCLRSLALMRDQLNVGRGDLGVLVDPC